MASSLSVSSTASSAVIVLPQAYRHAQRVLRQRVRLALYHINLHEFAPDANVVLTIRNGTITKVEIQHIDPGVECDKARMRDDPEPKHPPDE